MTLASLSGVTVALLIASAAGCAHQQTAQTGQTVVLSLGNLEGMRQR